MNVEKSKKLGMKSGIKGNTLSLIASGLLLTSTMGFAADSLDDALKNGKVSGSVIAYGTYTDTKSSTVSDSNGAYGTINLGYETASYKGFTAKAAFEAGHAVADAELANDALMTEAYVKYANDMFSVTAGRQVVNDLEWLNHYNEAVMASITSVPNTSIVLGYVNQHATADENEIGDFYDTGFEKGVYVADVKYSGLKGIVFNPYYYSAPDLASWYGLKTTFTADMFGAGAQYAASNEEVVGVEDGSIGHVNLNTKLAGISAGIGYIKTAKDGNANSMKIVGDTLSPLDAGNYVYSTDAKTAYGSLGYTIAGVKLGALYGQTTYSNADYKQGELNLTAGYSLTKSLSTSLLYADISADGSDSSGVDRNYGSLTIKYTF